MGNKRKQVPRGIEKKQKTIKLKNTKVKEKTIKKDKTKFEL